MSENEEFGNAEGNMESPKCMNEIDIRDVCDAATACFCNVARILEAIKLFERSKKDLSIMYRLKRKELKNMADNFLSFDEATRKRIDHELDALEEISVLHRARETELFEKISKLPQFL